MTMITNFAQLGDLKTWQSELADAVSDSRQLLSRLGLDINQLSILTQKELNFPLRVPESYIAKMTYGNPNDPLLRQILPIAQELIENAGFSEDPLAESERNPVPGIIHKYRGRVLLITSGACAINCRYCFRRHFPYNDNNPSLKQWADSLQYVADTPDIEEIILSGGDPLAASDKYLHKLVAMIAEIKHITRLRIHTRLPIVIPQRITQECLNWMDTKHFNISMVIHANHPNELDTRTHQSLTRLRDHGVILLNQSVLLAGINDCQKTLCDLSKKLFAQGVLPYYVHALDKVKGASHFDVPRETAQQLQKELMRNLPGYLVPKFVFTQPGAEHKVYL